MYVCLVPIKLLRSIGMYEICYVIVAISFDKRL